MGPEDLVTASRSNTGVLRRRECQTCGAAFTFEVGKGKTRRYCSTECRPKAKRPVTKTCAVDGCEKLRRSVTAEWCEMHYYRNRRNGDPVVGTKEYAPTPNCEHCGRPSPQKRFCSSRCATRNSRGVEFLQVCSECSSTFPRTNRTAVCSDACHDIRKKRWAREHHERAYATDPDYREQLRASYLKRRARLVGVETERFTAREIFERDQWACGLCGEEIPKHLKWPNPYSASIDHIIPLSKSGPHTRANVQAAHLTCNCRKNNRVDATA